MVETLDAGWIFNIVITTAGGLLVHFVKGWKSELAAQLSELYEDIKKLREDIFSLSLKEESMKGTYYSIFAKADEVQLVKQRLDVIKERIIKLEVANSSSIFNRRKEDLGNAATACTTS